MVHVRALTMTLICAAIAGCQPPQAAQAPVQAPAPVAPTGEAVKAGVGVGQQGRSLDGDTGVQQMISAPVSAYFKAKERIAFDIAVPHTVNLFQATEGRFPKSTDEFMEKIIKANQIALPKLPEGMMYQFHSDTGELWVHPINEAQPGTATGG
jgi:hypothetical protein